MGLLLTTGKRANAPYRIEWAGRNVWSLEELCFCMAQSAQFLDEQLLDPELVRWLSEECGLPELARRLAPYLDRPEAAPDFAAAILEESDYIPEERRGEIIRIIRAGEGLAHYEQREARADYMMDGGHFYQALAEYERILEELPEPERRLRARIEHSRGVIFAGLFNFAMAAECFQRAWSLNEDTEYYLDYLAAIRMYLPGTDYVAFVARHPEAYEASMELEKRMDEADGSYSSQPGTRQVEHLRTLWRQSAPASGKELLVAGEEIPSEPAQQFREELQGTIRNLRENYRLNLNRML